jgi:uncharacterized protein (TIGR00266 family)
MDNPQAGPGGLKYFLRGSVHQVVELHLEPGQRVFSETGAMIWMDANVNMETAAPGGGKGLLGAIGGALSRAVAGESLFLNYFSAQGGTGRVSFAASFPGKIIDVRLGPGQSLIGTRGSFLCGQDSCGIKIEWNKRIGSGFFGGEGFILQRISGPGEVFLEIDGELTIEDLAPGQTIKVDSGHIAAFEETVTYDIQFMSMKNIFLAGEGIALATLTGPGRVWLQHLTAQGVASSLLPYLPTRGG